MESNLVVGLEADHKKMAVIIYSQVNTFFIQPSMQLLLYSFPTTLSCCIIYFPKIKFRLRGASESLSPVRASHIDIEGKQPFVSPALQSRLNHWRARITTFHSPAGAELCVARDEVWRTKEEDSRPPPMDPAEQCLTPQHHIRSLLLESTGKTGHQQVITSGNKAHSCRCFFFLEKFVYLASLPEAI